MVGGTRPRQGKLHARRVGATADGAGTAGAKSAHFVVILHRYGAAARGGERFTWRYYRVASSMANIISERPGGFTHNRQLGPLKISASHHRNDQQKWASRRVVAPMYRHSQRADIHH